MAWPEEAATVGGAGMKGVVGRVAMSGVVAVVVASEPWGMLCPTPDDILVVSPD